MWAGSKALWPYQFNGELIKVTDVKKKKKEASSSSFITFDTMHLVYVTINKDFLIFAAVRHLLLTLLLTFFCYFRYRFKFLIKYNAIGLRR